MPRTRPNLTAKAIWDLEDQYTALVGSASGRSADAPGVAPAGKTVASKTISRGKKVSSISTPPHRSDSTEQRDAERELVSRLSGELGITLAPQTVSLEGSCVQIDGYSQVDDQIVLAEAFARLSTVKAGQRRKILADAFKLAYLTEKLREEKPALTVEAYLVFASKEAAAAVQGTTWAAHAIRAFGLQIKIFPLSAKTIQKVASAQLRQGADFR